MVACNRPRSLDLNSGRKRSHLASQMQTKPPRDHEMPFLDHLEELRGRLFWIGGSLVAGFAIGIALHHYFDLVTLLTRPACPYLPDGCVLQVFSPADQISLPFTLAGWVGVILASPVILYHLWAFVSPALHGNERRIAAFVLAGGLVLFCLGVAGSPFCVAGNAAIWREHRWPIACRELLGARLLLACRHTRADVRYGLRVANPDRDSDRARPRYAGLSAPLLAACVDHVCCRIGVDHSRRRRVFDGPVGRAALRPLRAWDSPVPACASLAGESRRSARVVVALVQSPCDREESDSRRAERRVAGLIGDRMKQLYCGVVLIAVAHGAITAQTAPLRRSAILSARDVHALVRVAERQPSYWP